MTVCLCFMLYNLRICVSLYYGIYSSAPDNGTIAPVNVEKP